MLKPNTKHIPEQSDAELPGKQSFLSFAIGVHRFVAAYGDYMLLVFDEREVIHEVPGGQGLVEENGPVSQELHQIC